MKNLLELQGCLKISREVIPLNSTVGPVSSGQHKIDSSRCKIMLFYAFKMALAIAFLRRNSKSKKKLEKLVKHVTS